MKKTIDFLKSINKNIYIFILICIAVLLFILNINSCQKRNEENKTYKQNEEAMKKQINIEKDKNGKLVYSVALWEGKYKDLDNYSQELKNEIDSLKKSKVKYITIIELRYIHDTIIVDNTLQILGQDKYQLSWEYTNNDTTRLLKGRSQFFAKINETKDNIIINPYKTFIDKDEIKIKLITGIRKNEKTGLDEIFVKSKTDGVSIIGLEGANLDPVKKKNFSIGFNLGYGISIYQQKIIAAPYIGIGISKNLINF